LPGETVDVHDGGVYINGRRLEEPYTIGPTERGDPYLFRGNLSGQSNIFPYTVPPDLFFRDGRQSGRFSGQPLRRVHPARSHIGTPIMI